MSGALKSYYGSLLAVRPPVPVTINLAGANYKSEVAHTEYSPRRAYDEWLSICEGILACGGDAVFDFEPDDDRWLDVDALEVDAGGDVRVAGGGERRGHVGELSTGRVFTANGPWVVVDRGELRALMPNMLAHRRAELPYYERLLEWMAEAGGYLLEIEHNPHRWEGLADVAVVGDTAVLTYTVRGHYDAGVGDKTMRSSREGVEHAAAFAGVPEDRRLYAELVYPHFHGDTVHFGARPAGGAAPVLVHYPGGLWGDGAARVAAAVPVVPIERDDAVEQYAGNSRQVAGGVLVPDGVSDAFASAMTGLGLSVTRVPLFELFGKAGGGPACATLYLPENLKLPADAPMRYSVRRAEARARRARIPARVTVDPAFFAGRRRG